VDVDPLDYALLVREALLEVPRRALRLVAREGLPGEHHFFLSFRTGHPGVSISPSLRARHPEEMTVVLQHRYWDLAVGDDAFSVTLRFGGVPERLHVPFAALTAFADPAGPPPPGDDGGAEGEDRSGNVVDIRSFRRPDEESGEEGEPEPEPEPTG
jgi:hypothetical protein